ncbi:hypothetical protein MKX03_016803 [Papaver bracteatum]|nr:hypothetical protein MKX03_016803 [Papaver bracteatum]
MSRVIRVEKEKKKEGEVWFSVEGRDLCFCKEDYKEVTSLSFEHSVEEFDSQKEVLNLLTKHFGGNEKVLGGDLYNFLVFNKKLMGGDKRKNIKSDTKNECSKTFRGEDPVECPSGDRKAFSRQDDKKKPPKSCSLKPDGMPQALVVWMLKLFPHLLGKYGKELDSKRSCPLLLTVVLCEKAIAYKKFCDDMKGIVFREDILKKIRAVGEEFREATWKEGVSENHDLEDASEDAPHDDQDQAMDSSDDNRHVIPVVPEQNRVEMRAGDACRGSHLGVVVAAEFLKNMMADVTKEMINSVQEMIGGFSEKMNQLSNSHEQRIGSVESKVHQLLKTTGAPPENHTVGGLESAGPSKDGDYRNDESNVEDCGLGPTCKDGYSRNDESSVEDCGLERAAPNKDGDSRNDESKEDETMGEILTEKFEEENGRPIDMNHTGAIFDDSALHEENDSDGVKSDVRGPRPDTSRIRQDEPVEVI